MKIQKQTRSRPRPRMIPLFPRESADKERTPSLPKNPPELDRAIEVLSKQRKPIRKTACILVLHNVGSLQQPQFRFSDGDLSQDDLLRMIQADLDPLVISCNSPDFPSALSGTIGTDQALRILSEAVRKMRARESSDLRESITEAAREVLGSDRAELYEKVLGGVVASILVMFYAPVPGSEDDNWRVIVRPVGGPASISMPREDPPIVWARKQVLQFHFIELRGPDLTRRYYQAAILATAVCFVVSLWLHRPVTARLVAVLSAMAVISLPFVYLFANHMRFIPVTRFTIGIGMALFCLPPAFALARLSAVYIVDATCRILSYSFSKKNRWHRHSMRLLPLSAIVPLGLVLIWNLLVLTGLESFGATVGAGFLMIALAFSIGGKSGTLLRFARL